MNRHAAPNWRALLKPRKPAMPDVICYVCGKASTVEHLFGDGDVIFSCPACGDLIADVEQVGLDDDTQADDEDF